MPVVVVVVDPEVLVEEAPPPPHADKPHSNKSMDAAMAGVVLLRGDA